VAVTELVVEVAAVVAAPAACVAVDETVPVALDAADERSAAAMGVQARLAAATKMVAAMARSVMLALRIQTSLPGTEAPQS
jgi:hypothetical protein